MNQWEYCSIRWTYENLTLLSYSYNNIRAQTISVDPIGQGDPSLTIRRHIAYLGLEGWELAAILPRDEEQEWVLKRPLIIQ